MMVTSSYRKDIDGLRAVAVLLVVLYHAYPDELRGGFIGVDIFFVISGYLITGILLNDLAKNRFSLHEFYARRVRRIFPALIVVMVACLALGWFTLLGDEFKLLGRQLTASSAFIANLALWQDVGYFDAAAEKKPLLHLWSLGVEEQFYLIFPLLLWLARKREITILALLLALSAASLTCYLALGVGQPASAFYLPQARFWQLMGGALVAYWQIKRTPPTTTLAEPLAIMGIVSLGGALYGLRTGPMFAGLWSLLPVLGTMGLLISATAWFNRRVLGANPMVWIGKISYPLYLWHWVLLSYCHVFEDSKPFFEVRNPALVLSFVLAGLTYRYVEQPIRFGSLRAWRARYLLLPMAMLGASGWYIQISEGVPARAAAKVKVANVGDLGPKEFVDYLRDHFYDCKGTHWNERVTEGIVQSRCVRNHGDERAVSYILMGDSHAEHLYIGLAASYPEVSFAYTTREGLPLLSNPGFFQLFKSAAEDHHIRGILLSAHWASKLQGNDPQTFRRDLEATLAYFAQHGKDVYLFDDVPIFPFNAQRCAYHDRLWITHMCDASLADVMRNPINLEMIVTPMQVRLPHIYYIDPSHYLCRGNRCSMTHSGQLLYRDRNHLNIQGSIYIGRSIHADHPNWFNATRPPSFSPRLR